MKQIKWKTLLLSSLLTCAFTGNCAEDDTGGSDTGTDTWSTVFRYQENGDGTITITGYYDYPYEIAIPSEIDGKAVTGIGNRAFSGCSSLKSVEIPDSVTSIGDWAFERCNWLTSFSVSPDNTSFKSEDGLLLSKDGTELISVPPGLGQIHWESVDGTNSVPVTNGVTKITVPDSVTQIGDYAFYGCSGLTGVTIPDSVTIVGDWAFRECKGLTNVTIGSGVTRIGNRAFSGCSELKGVTIPDSVTIVGDWAFRECKGLTNVTIGSGVTRIGNRAFSGCSGLTSFSVSPGNKVFKSEAGLLLSKDGAKLIAVPMGLTEVTIPDGVTSIGDYAFAVETREDISEFWWNYGGGVRGLTSVTIPDSVTRIGNYAFWGCSALTSIVIPDSVTSIGEGAFAQCGDSWDYYTGDDGDMDDDSAWVSEVVGLESVTIGSGVTSIGDYAFLACHALTSIEIPDSVTSIGDGAFFFCRSLTSVEIPDTVTNIGENSVFSDCYNLESVTIGNGVTSIGMQAFYNCWRLTSVTIPDSVTSIGDYAFADCSSLTSVTIPDSVTSIGDYAFEYCSGLTSVTIGNGVARIGSSAFSGCSRLTNVTIPDSVTSIGDSAFKRCSDLASVTIPDSVTSIGGGAFYGCSESLFDTTTIPGVKLVDGWAVDSTESLSGDLNLAGIRGIGGSAFYNCSGLTSVTIPDSVTSIGDSAFKRCSGLTSVTIPDSVTSIKREAFSGCSGLTSVTIPDSVNSIGVYTFYGCSGLTSVTIPDSVNSIGDCAFSCENLSEVVFEGNRDEIEMNVFTAFRDTPWLTAYIGTFPVPANDAFANAALLPEGSPFTAEGVNINASVEENDPLAVSRLKSKSTVWWKWTAEADGEITFDTSESDFGVVVGVFTGDSLETLVRVASNAEPWAVPDSGGSSSSGSWNDLVTFETSAGATYYIVAGGSGSEVGNIVLQGYRYRLEIEDGLLYGYSGTLPETLAIPEGVTEVAEGAFAGTGIAAVSLPSSLQSIGRGAFDGCKALASVTIPDSVTSIGNGAFDGCESLTEVVFEGNPEELEMDLEDAFAGTSWLEAYLESLPAATYTLTFDSAGGSEVAPITQEAGTEIVPPSAPVREGYTFVGWEPELPATMPETNLTLTAVWEEVIPPPSPSTPEIFEEEPVDAFEGNAQYTGWLRDADGNLVGTVTVKAAKANAKTKVSKLSATVVLLDTGKKLTFNGTAAAGQFANVTLSGKSGSLNATLSDDSVTGTFGAYTVEAAKNVFVSKTSDDKASAALVGKKTWTVTLASAKGYTPFTLAVAAKGKAKVTGVLPDGTKVSVSAQAVVGDGGRWAVPVMYAKKSKFGFVAWFAKGADGQTSLTGVSDLTPLRGPKNAVTEWQAVPEACGPAGSLAAGAHALYVSAEDVAAIVPGVNADLLPSGEAVTVAKGKWTLAKAAKVAYKGGWTVTPAAKGGAAANASAAKLAFTAKTGTFKGSFTAYSVKGGKLAKTKFSVNGAVVDGVAYGTAFNKTAGNVPVVIE